MAIRNEMETCVPFVSVVIPVFNDESGLLNCVAGLRKQTYPTDRIEIIAVDNGSTVPIRPCENKLSSIVIISCEKPGSYAARNAGARAAKGDILAFTDADCVPDPEWLSKGVAALLAGDGKSVIGGEILFTQPVKRSGTALYQQAVGFEQEANIRRKGFSATANMFCTAKQFRATGPFNDQLLSGGDRDWCWRASQHGWSVHFDPYATVHTEPRIRLRDAVRQARRVAAGRAYLSGHDLVRPDTLARYRTLGQSIIWVISIPYLSAWERIRVLTAGAIIRLAAAIENVSLRFGTTAERR